MVDITLPSGKVIRGVPAGTSKQEIKRRAIAAGFATEQDFASTTSLGTSASPGPTPLERFQSVDPMLMEQAPIDPRALVGAAETIATFGTGTVAEPVAGVVGLATSPFQGAGQGVRNIQATRQALTYQPRTQAGQRAVSEIGQGLQPAAEVISQPSQYLGERGYQYGGPVLGAIGQTAIPAAMEMIPGARALRTVRERGMPEPSMQPAPVTPEAPIGQATPTTQAEPELTQPTREGVEQVNVGLQGIRRGRTEALASQVMPDMQIMQDAEALGISLNPAHYSTSRAYIDMENSLKSRLGTELASAEEKAIRDLGIQADRLIQDFGGYTDRDLLNAEVRSNFTTTIKDLKTKSDYLYQDVVDARIPAEVRVTPENSIAYLEQQKTKLGGNTRLFNQAEKDLLNLVKDTDSPPTYFALNRVRMNIGRAMRGEDSPYSSLGRAELAQAYSVLSNDQMNVADAFGVGNDLRDANALVAKRKNIEDWVEELNDFGADEEDLVTNIKQLKQAYIYSGNRENVLDEIKINKPLTKPIIVRKGKEGITAEYYYVFKEDNPQLPDYFFGDSDGSLVKMFKTKMWINLYQAPRHIRSEKTKELTSFLNQKGIQAIQKSKYNEDIIEIPLNQIRIKIIEN